MKNLKVRTKLSMLLAAMIIAMVALIGMSIYGMNGIRTSAVSIIKNSISQDYDDQIQNEVETAISICDMYYAYYEAGAMPLEDAKRYSADVISMIADVRENFSKAKDAAELTRTKCVDHNDTMSSLSATLEDVSNELTELLEVFRVSDL